MAFAKVNTTRAGKKVKVQLTSLLPYIVTGYHDKHQPDGRITQKALAEQLGISLRTVTRWRHTGCTPEEFEVLCEFFGMRPEVLLGRKFYNEVFVHGISQEEDEGPARPRPGRAAMPAWERRQRDAARKRQRRREYGGEGQGVPGVPGQDGQVAGGAVREGREGGSCTTGDCEASHYGGSGGCCQEVLQAAGVEPDRSHTLESDPVLGRYCEPGSGRGVDEEGTLQALQALAQKISCQEKEW